MWTCRNDYSVIKLSEWFNSNGLKQIQFRISRFEHICKFPEQYSLKERSEFYKIPYNKIAWGS